MLLLIECWIHTISGLLFVFQQLVHCIIYTIIIIHRYESNYSSLLLAQHRNRPLQRQERHEHYSADWVWQNHIEIERKRKKTNKNQQKNWIFRKMNIRTYWFIIIYLSPRCVHVYKYIFHSIMLWQSQERKRKTLTHVKHPKTYTQFINPPSNIKRKQIWTFVPATNANAAFSYICSSPNSNIQ